jgi:hypothetical protein
MVIGENDRRNPRSAESRIDAARSGDLHQAPYVYASASIARILK